MAAVTRLFNRSGPGRRCLRTQPLSGQQVQREGGKEGRELQIECGGRCYIFNGHMAPDAPRCSSEL
ncbi:hypothetical protein EYF80_052475 [Liparis tanakae]|uniref:Uncharacterized protein n=1 Tax=Liparis tanakae TaxID=230148 RepID=A0A4Z2F823_9TELE|nr:hypothetical protein EYF80_052475 [Liparis tanakae]